MNPRITTIIPAFNAAPTVREAVNSVRAAEIDDHEIIVVNDGSTDHTPDLAEELALGDDRVWVIHQERAGVSAARNAGLRVARGRWLHFLDADDWMLPGGLGCLLRALEDDDHRGGGGALGACGGAAMFDHAGKPLNWSIGASAPPGVPDIGMNELLKENRFQAGSCLIPADAALGMRFDETLSASEDWDFWLRLAERGLRWRVVPRDVSAYRQSPGGLSRAWGAMAGQTRAVLEGAFNRCRRRHTAIVPQSDLRRERELDVIRRHAIGNASGAALEDHDRGVDEAFTVLTLGMPGGAATPEALAWGAFWKLPHADGLAPSAWRTAEPTRLSRYAAALDRFWKRLVAENVCGQRDLDAARRELAGMMVEPARIAERLAAQCSVERTITLLGVGQNATHVARALQAGGFRFDARDDRAAPGVSFGVLAGLEVEIHGSDSTFNPDALHIMTVGDDAAYLSSLPSGLEVLRWNDAREQLLGVELNRLLHAWPGEFRLGAAA